MSERSAAILAEVLKLSNKERAEIVEEILLSLENQSSNVDSMTQGELAKELDRRHQEFLDDPSVAISMDEVKRLTRIR